MKSLLLLALGCWYLELVFAAGPTSHASEECYRVQSELAHAAWTPMQEPDGARPFKAEPQTFCLQSRNEKVFGKGITTGHYVLSFYGKQQTLLAQYDFSLRHSNFSRESAGEPVVQTFAKSAKFLGPQQVRNQVIIRWVGDDRTYDDQGNEMPTQKLGEIQLFGQSKYQLMRIN